ncbi:hypothetical protein ABZY20_13920 [Streptomyces sp. NPDC006624]
MITSRRSSTPLDGESGLWNRPELTDGFRARLTALLGGHRTAYVWGKV